jgi:hypothetical protein
LFSKPDVKYILSLFKPDPIPASKLSSNFPFLNLYLNFKISYCIKPTTRGLFGAVCRGKKAENEGNWDWKVSGRMCGTITLGLNDEVFNIEI